LEEFVYRFVTKIMLVGSLLAANAFGSLIINGGFETGTVDPGTQYLNLPTSSIAIDGWLVASGDVNYLGTLYQASEGTKSVDLNGDGPGSISQSFSTVLGSIYVVLFDLAGNPDGTPVVKTLEVSAAGQSQQYLFDTTGHNSGQMGWTPQVFQFTATDTTTTLQFASLSTGPWGPTVDNVSVDALDLGSVPEPSTLALLGAGLAGFAVIRRRK
jgi:choice-of-anchor C domain-containing protein